MSAVTIEIEDRSGLGIDTGSARALATKALARVGFSEGELGVAYIPEAEMARLNREYLDREGPTDVLSFPLDADEALAEEEKAGPGRQGAAAGGPAEGGAPRLLGDVIICPGVAADQAAELGSTVERELCLLLVHGILHIAGYDHEADSGEMEELQQRLVGELCG